MLVNTVGEELGGGKLTGGDDGGSEDDGGIDEESDNEEEGLGGTEEVEMEDEEGMLEALDGVDTVELRDELGNGDEKRLLMILPIFPKPPPICPVCEGVREGDGVRVDETWFEPSSPPRIPPKPSKSPLLGILFIFLPFV